MIRTIIDLLFLIIGSLLLLSVAYLYFLGIASFFPEKKKKKADKKAKFAVIIPAQDESAVIHRTLKSLQEMRYPKNLCDVYVIADNCLDNTAEVVRNMNIPCWERHDANLRGKGHALQWAFTRLLQAGDHEAYVIIDADTVVDCEFLNCMNQRVYEGGKAIQGYYDVLDPDRSPMRSLSYLGFVLNRNLRYLGRSRLSWTSNLLGNGMCFTRDIIRKYGWCATSITEDIEYEMMLHLNGIRVIFAAEAKIYAEIPDTFRRSKTQRGRWDTGKFAVRNKYFLKLISAGFRKKDISYFDSALELLIPPFSLFVFLIALCFILFLLLNHKTYAVNSIVWMSIMPALGVYILTGLIRARGSLKIYLSLLYAPYFIVWRLYVVIKKRLQRGYNEWVKTKRE